jgi:hypothetical protein
MKIDDNFGANQLLKDIIPQSHIIDIRVRMDGKYYWFEGDFLKQVLPNVEFIRIEKDTQSKLEDHAEILPHRPNM